MRVLRIWGIRDIIFKVYFEGVHHGKMVLKEWDRLFVYTDKYLADATEIEV